MRAQDNDTTARDRDRDGQQTRDNDTRDGKITPADNECAGGAVQCSAVRMSCHMEGRLVAVAVASSSLGVAAVRVRIRSFVPSFLR